jgi:hypothetical protein
VVAGQRALNLEHGARGNIRVANSRLPLPLGESWGEGI